MTDESLNTVAENCPNLKTMSAVNCLKVTEAPVLKAAENCKGLQHLRVSCTSQTDASIAAVANECSGLLRSLVARCFFLLRSVIVFSISNGFLFVISLQP